MTNITYIPQRLKSAAKNGFVTGAIDIKDDIKNKNQQTINQETDEHLGEHDTEIADRYTKEEVNNIISRTPETDVIVIDVPVESQSDIAGYLDENTSSSGRANKLYRVPGPDNTTFSEWAWDGTAYRMLANKDYGIDEMPTVKSSNVVKSGGIYITVNYNSAITGVADGIANGTYQNPSNTNAVRTCFVPTNGAKSVIVETNRPNTEGYHYIYGWTLIKSEKDLGKTDYIGDLEGGYYNLDYAVGRDYPIFNIFDYAEEVVGVACILVEYNGTDYHPLRVDDFSGYYIKINCGIEDRLFETKQIAFGGNSLQIYTQSNSITVEESLSPATDSNIYIHDERWFIRERWPQQYLNNAAIAEEMGVTLVTSPKGYPNCLKIESGNNLVYNISKKQLIIQDRSIRDDSIVIVSCFQGKAVKISETILSNVIRNINEQYDLCLTADFNAKYDIFKKKYHEDGGIVSYIMMGYTLTPNVGELVYRGNIEFSTTLEYLPLKKGDRITGTLNNFGTYDLLCVYDKAYRPIYHVISQGYTEMVDVDYTAKEDVYFRVSSFRNALYSNIAITFGAQVSLEQKVTIDKADYLDRFKYAQRRFTLNVRDGSYGNPANVSCVSTEIFPVSIYKRFKLVTNRPNTEGYHYEYEASGLSVESFENTSLKVDYRTENHVDMVNQRIEVPCTRRLQETKGFVFMLYEVSDTSRDKHNLRVSDFENYYIGVECMDVFSNNEGIGNIVSRNQDKTVMLTASCRYRKESNDSKDFQMLIVTDSHDDNPTVTNAVLATNGFNMIDALIHCGDITDKILLTTNVDDKWKNIVNNSEKPFYFVIGNHDVGNYLSVSSAQPQENLYDMFIKPTVDKGYLVNGEYIVGKCYYYHDFTNSGVRLIVLNEYEVPIIPNTTQYWKPITYSNSYSNYENNTSYVIGNKVNVSGYTDYSFEAMSDFNSGGYYDFRAPAIKYSLGYRWISQAQAQWFLDTLASTPSGYKIIVACHNPFSNKADVVQTVKFSQKNGWVNGYGSQNYMVNDFIADAINAFVNKYSFTTTCSSIYPVDMPSYTVSKDFSAVSAFFHSLIGGHVHQDCVWKHQVYNQYQITPICANTNNYAQCPNADIRRPSSSVVNELSTDCLTVVSFGSGRIGLVKIGMNVTETGERRDYEVINIA